MPIGYSALSHLISAGSWIDFLVFFSHFFQKVFTLGDNPMFLFPKTIESQIEEFLNTISTLALHQNVFLPDFSVKKTKV